MKFFVAALVLVLALGAESSVLPWGHLGLGHLGYGAALPSHGLVAAVPGHYAAPGISLAQGPILGGHLAAPAAVALHAGHALHAPAAVVAGAPVHGAGTYVAQTRGASHVAPLPGHIASATSINVQPAPGTW